MTQKKLVKKKLRSGSIDDIQDPSCCRIDKTTNKLSPESEVSSEQKEELERLQMNWIDEIRKLPEHTDELSGEGNVDPEKKGGKKIDTELLDLIQEEQERLVRVMDDIMVRHREFMMKTLADELSRIILVVSRKYHEERREEGR